MAETSEKVDVQPQIKKRLDKVLGVVREHTDSTLKDITFYFIREEKLTPETNDPKDIDDFINRWRSNIRYCLSIMLKDKKVRMRKTGAERGAWKKTLWRVNDG